jgi:hypothetical protein
MIQIGAIRLGIMIAQIVKSVGLPLMKDFIGLLKQEKVDLPTLEKILEDVEKHQKEADEATDKILNH